ncbi:MAG: ABC transporter substrate-binding protein, partial [Gammaproteobacteria bacterium]
DGPVAIGGAYLARMHAGKRVAILHDRTLASHQLAVSTKRAMNSGGLQETLFIAFPAGERDYAPLARTLKSQAIATIYIGGYPIEAAAIIRDLAAADARIEVVGGDLLAGEDFLTAAGAWAEGVIVVAPVDPNSWPGASRLRRQAGTNRSELIVQAVAYAAIEIGVQLLQTADGNHDAFGHGRRFATILGEVAFDSKGDAILPFHAVHRWSNGQLVPIP